MTRAIKQQAAGIEASVMAGTTPVAPSPNEGPLHGLANVRRQLARWRQPFILVGAITTLFIVVGTINPMFLSGGNLASIFAGNAYIAIAALGMSLVIICRHIDVSVGALIGVLAMVSGSLAVHGFPTWMAWLGPVAMGVLVNAFVGVLVAYGRIPSIVVTLGMLSILKGGLISVTGGAWLSNLPPGFLIAQFQLLGIPSTVWSMTALTLGTAIWMHWSIPGRTFYAVGCNAEAAQVAGIRTAPTVVLAFAMHGGFAGIAAVLFATQMQVIQATVPAGLELTIIAAAVVGGVSILGGRGLVVGATLAAILFATINSSLIFLDVPAHWFRATQALLILGTVLGDLAKRGRIR
jgi:ribose/xylose/arabinose/galactoside ABC-type transport system permease subunit